MTVTVKNLFDDIEIGQDFFLSHRTKVLESRTRVERALEIGRPIYGLNTGFGALAQSRIDKDDLQKLQENLLVSHACGIGDPIPPSIASLMLKMKVRALAQGLSGVSLPVFKMLSELCENKIVPYIPSRGSVGASGDLAPLAHLGLVLLGRGMCWNVEHTDKEHSSIALRRAKIKPVTLGPKDGLAIINGTQMMTAYGAFVLHYALTLIKAADILAAMSIEALKGSASPFDPRLHTARPHPGQIKVADNIRMLLAGSEILESHASCGKVQDPYSLRCVPQVHGATRDALFHAIEVVEREINSVTDNPLVLGDGDIVSGGNFHGQSIALVLDYAAIALSELASMSERRSYLLLHGCDGLPVLLTSNSGLNSGYMVPQYTAAALVSENKVLSHPASVDSIPTSLGQEDHVSMGSVSAHKLLQVFRNTEAVLAVEMLTAAQALDFRLPVKPGCGVYKAHNHIRNEVPHGESDHELGAELEVCRKMLNEGSVVRAVEAAIGPLY